MKLLLKVMSLSIISLLTLTGCGKGIADNVPQTASAEKASEDSDASNNPILSQSELETTVADASRKPAKSFDMADGSIIEYYDYSKALPPVTIFKEGRGDTYVVNNDFPSLPSESPDKSKIAYLSPYEWEVLSNVYIFDTATRKNKIVLSVDDVKNNKSIKEQSTPKKVIWLDNDHLLLIIQFAFGTVVQGGDLYSIDLSDNEITQLTKMEKYTEITDIYLENGRLAASIIKFTDENMTKYDKYKSLIQIGELYEAIKNKTVIAPLLEPVK